MSVNKYDASTGTLTTIANGQRTWVGTKQAYDQAKIAGTLPTNCLVAITDDEVDHNHYSTNETETGTYWIDGKPIYQKTLLFPKSQLQGSGERYYPHGLSNVETIWFVPDASFISTLNTTGQLHWSMFCHNGTIEYSFTGVWVKPADDTYNGLSIYIGTSLWSVINLDPNAYMVVTVRYTKTTD